MPLPSAIVLDLDNLVWFPEMYHLWGGGGAPFRPNKNGNVVDRSGTEVYLMGDLREMLIEVDTDPKWEGTVVCVASSCDEPAWARECMSKIYFDLDRKRTLQDIVSVAEIHKGSKAGHLRNIHEQTGIPLQEMVFFDDQRGNCQAVSTLGVTCYYIPDNGITKDIFEDMQNQFPQPGKIFQY